MPDLCSRRDVVVVGAGIIGLAVAREVLRRRPGARVLVLDAAAAVGTQQTTRNSGVVHAGIYYAPGSLKARLCVEGARELYAYCAERSIRHQRCGKLIVALQASELPALDELERRGRANGVPGLRRVGAAQLREIEPHAAGIAALRSAHTGIADFAAVARAFADDVRAGGGEVVTGCAVRRIRSGGASRRRGVAAAGQEAVVEHALGATPAGRAIACAGAFADRLAVASGASADPRIVPFRGAYLKLRPDRRDLVRGLLYPVPDPALPFLGVHISRHVDGEVILGPTALLLPRRRSLAWPGTWRLARRFWRTGLRELRYAASRRAYVAEAARYLPGLRAGDVEPAFTGVRAQALARDGSLLDDFAFSVTGSVLHVRNAPSPAATSAMAIARHVVDAADRS
jgi:(S)-2-hydroxyglutarate dehydrogenase